MNDHINCQSLPLSQHLPRPHVRRSAFVLLFSHTVPLLATFVAIHLLQKAHRLPSLDFLSLCVFASSVSMRNY